MLGLYHCTKKTHPFQFGRAYLFYLTVCCNALMQCLLCVPRTLLPTLGSSSGNTVEVQFFFRAFALHFVCLSACLQFLVQFNLHFEHNTIGGRFEEWRPILDRRFCLPPLATEQPSHVRVCCKQRNIFLCFLQVRACRLVTRIYCIALGGNVSSMSDVEPPNRWAEALVD